MSLPRFSVRRPVLTTMVALIVIILGLVSLSRLRIDMLPTIEFPTISVRTSYDGASPEVMEQLVTRFIEEIVSVVPGIEEVTSESYEGGSSVRIRFGWGTDINTAAIDVQAKIEDEINELPEEIQRPRVSKFDIASFPVVIIGVASSLDPVDLTEVVEDQLRYRFSRIPGVAQVDVWGGYNREIRIEVDPDRLRAKGIPLNRVIQVLRDSNLDLPTGTIELGRYEMTLRAPAQFMEVEEIGQTVIEVRDGAAITVNDIARVSDTYERLTRYVRINDERGVRIAIRKQADANTVEVARRVLAEIEESNQRFPQLRIHAVTDQGNFIERSITNVANSVLYGGGLAVIVLLFFLRNLRSTFVISLAIPISIIATFALIYFAGLTLNLMTLGGLALGVGMMVDSSIVVLENIFRHRDEEKKDPATAAIDGAQEVATAIIASTITTLVIFLPLVFVQGISGMLFKELAYVIVFSLICSLLVSLSLVPMLASKLLKAPQELPAGHRSIGQRFNRKAEGLFNSLENSYRDLLQLVLHRRWTTIGICLAMLAASFLLLPLIGTEFMPPSDEGEVRVSGEMEQGTRIDLVNQQTQIIENIVLGAVPETVSSVTDVRNSRGEVRLSLSPSTQRSRSNTEIANDLRARLEGKVPAMEVRVRAPQGQFLLSRLLGSDEGLTIDVMGYDLDILNALAQQVLEELRDIPGITDLDMVEDSGIPQEEIRIDRAKIANLGLSARTVAEVLKTAVAGSQAGEFKTEGDAFRILVQLANAEQLSLDQILSLTIELPSGDQVALRNLVQTQSGTGPVVIKRKNQQRYFSVLANISGRDLGSVARDVQERLDQIPRPDDYNLLVAGNFDEQQKAFQELVISLLLAIILVYMVLASQYESLRNPLVVMFSVPMAAIGVLLTLFITNTTLNLQSYIGCIMLGGIVVNNAILLVDQAGILNRAGMGVYASVAEAGRRRLRPILMTTLTTILGLMPLALGIGEGADAQAPLARAVIGGLTGSTLITLVLIPVVFTLFHPDKTEATD